MGNLYLCCLFDCFRRFDFSEEDAAEMAYLATPPYLKLLANGNSTGSEFNWKLQDWRDFVGQLGALVRQTSVLYQQSYCATRAMGRRSLRALTCEALAFLCSSTFETRVRSFSSDAPLSSCASAPLPALQLFLEYLLEKLILLALEQPAAARNELSHTERIECALTQVYHENNLPLELAALIGRLNQRSQKRLKHENSNLHL